MMRIELSETESKQIVKKATRNENVKIIEFKLENFGNYFGFLGEYFRLEIEAEVENVPKKFNFFVKSLPLKDLKQRKMLIEEGIFRKEVKIYEKLLLNLNEISGSESFWCADGYLFRDDLLVLEDLSLKGFKMLPFRFKFETPHVEVTLKSLASFHASSIVYEEMNGENSIEKEFNDFLFETSVANIKWYHAGLKSIYDIALQKTKYGASHTEFLKENLYVKLFESIENMETNPHSALKVLSHRDLWTNNMMFRFCDDSGFENPTHCALLDFQTVRYLALSVDVLMAIICNTSRSHYEKHYEKYLKFYYECLATELKKFNLSLSRKMSFANFQLSCDYHKTFTLIYNVIVTMITTIPKDFFVNFTEDEYRDFAEGNRSKFILKNMETDPIYRDSLVEAVESAIEFIFKLP